MLRKGESGSVDFIMTNCFCKLLSFFYSENCGCTNVVEFCLLCLVGLLVGKALFCPHKPLQQGCNSTDTLVTYLAVHGGCFKF